MPRVDRIAALGLVFAVVGAFAQKPCAQRPGLFFREEWKQTTEVPITQQFVSNPDLELKL